MNEYRCTRHDLYPPFTPGHSDLIAREGHYIRAETPEEAEVEMQRRFPKDRYFTIQLHKALR